MSTWKMILVVGVALALNAPGGVTKAQGIKLGVTVLDTPWGVEITSVVPGGIADRDMPRLKPGAHIVAVEGAPVTSAEQFRQALRNCTFVRFQFIDPTGELRWARAWSGGRRVLYSSCDCRP